MKSLQRMDGKMSTILLAEQSMLQEQYLEGRLCSLGHQITSVADADLLNMVKLHPYDMVIWSYGVLDESMKEYIRQIRKFTDVPVMRVRFAGDIEPNSMDIEGLFDGCIDASLDREGLEEIINYHLREAYRKTHNVRLYQYKGLKIANGSIKRVEMKQKSLDLTVKEYMILSLLMCHRDCIYTKASLYESVWRQPYMGDDNAVKIHISNLRSKLKKADPDENYIETVWGQGYRLCKN